MIVKLSELSLEQKQRFVTVFGESFFDMIDKKGKNMKKLQVVFGDAFLPQFAYAYLDGEDVAGLITCSNSQSSAMCFSKSVCKSQFGSILGAINYRFFKSLFGKPFAKADDEGYIDFLCVDSGHRRRGIATKLMNHVYAQTQFKHYLLAVLAKNSGAIKLYKKEGYTIIRDVKELIVRIAINDYTHVMLYSKTK
ncbi:MAG: GNAT family N-acetyltransferase [Clostridia bacterium]|jgi:ribosomal protein S18 acetylase RimI-like enzyme|nr:GNAT family N-acetyltransferase [Clostridia bacterium]MBT7122296.1 GNAT family N-acetyltransferase [Clostridia bacterium]